MSGRNDDPGKFFVGSLSWDTDQDSLWNYFSQYGEVSDAVVIMDRQTGRSRGFGFVTFRDPRCVDSVLRGSHTIDGRQMNPISVTAVEESYHEIRDDKSYLCSVCGKILHSFSGLRRHNMNHQDKKKWECQICHKTFVEKDHFTGHVSAHHKIGLFACKKCHKEHAYKASFTRHMKVCKKADNTNIQEYKCDICSSTFNKKDILNDHVKGKHGCSTGHYPCSVCGKRFRYRASRSKHTKSVHK